MLISTRPRFFDDLAALSDATRCRILLSLARHELTVTELCTVLQLPQSTVSRHLKILADGGWIHTRPEGTRRLYALVPNDLSPTASSLWDLAREEIEDAPGAREDLRRLESVLAHRRVRSKEFFDSTAGQWDRMRDDLFGDRAHLHSLLGLLSEEWTVGDLGCGTGPVTRAIAPFVREVIAVDDSSAMLDAAGAWLEGVSNVELRRGELEALPVEDGSLDAATLILVLHHVPAPAQVLTEVARVLKPGGKLLLVDMLPHDRQEYQQQMGHVWLGFSEAQLGKICSAACLEPGIYRPLPVDPDARGPGLFALTTGKPKDPERKRTQRSAG